MDAISPPGRTPYNPHFDPLRHASPGTGQDYAPTYWVASAGTPPADDGPVTQDLDTGVVVVGSGYTGLACALFLAREYGIKATVLEANRVAWGCSTRNGGQGQNAAGRLSRSHWIARWGEAAARGLHAEITEGFGLFTALTKEFDCDPQPGGHLYIAHRKRALELLRVESEICNRIFGYPTKILSRQELHENYLREDEAAGALHEPLGIGVHPAKFAFGYLQAVRAAGAAVHPASPVMRITRQGTRFHVQTPGGVVRADAVAIAAGGYAGQGLHPWLRGRIMPILSNSLVTRPLNPAELAATAFQTRQVITDTRLLRHYYRLLPDNRLQIGGRSAISGADAVNPVHQQRLVEALIRKFPALRGIDIDYSWSGWVDVSHDMMPRIVQPDAGEQLFYAAGYGGNGVSYSAQAGRRLAALVAGHEIPAHLPIFKGELPRHMFTPFRRIGQRMIYQMYQRRDERPDRR